MYREGRELKRRTKASAKPSKTITVLLVIAIATLGFATLMIRLEMIQEGYRLSEVGLELQKAAQENQRLRLEAAELSSYHRLRTLAPRYGLRPADPRQIVMMR
jgi:cell division protein FtsL